MPDIQAQLNFIMDSLSRDIAELRRQQRILSEQVNAAGVTYAFPECALADAPLAADGQASFEVRHITDGRKSGESASNGTGVPAFYDVTTDSWRLFDGTAVQT